MQRSRLARYATAAATVVASMAVAPLSSADETPDESRRHELVSQRSETSQTFQNPDGSLTTEVASQPVRFREDDGSWSAIDTTLVKRGGGWAPKASPTLMTFSDGGDAPFAEVQRDGGDSVALGWPSALPEPEVEGSTLTYPDVVPSGDLVVTAVPNGFSHSLVLREAPSDPNMKITLPVDLSGSKLAERSDGGLKVTSYGDKPIQAPAPMMWDASTGAFGLPDNTESVDASVSSTGGETTLVLTPDAGMLADPKTEYPVTIDPTFTQDTPTSDTFVNSQGTYSQSNLTKNWDYLVTGYAASSDINARTFLKFPNFDFAGKQVTGAELQVRNVKSNVCTNASTIAERITTANWSESTLTWANQPGVDTSYSPPQYFLAHGGPSGSGCTAHDWGRWNITRAVQAWESGAPNYGLRLRAATEGSANHYRNWRAQEGVTAGTGTTYYPKIAVTYDVTSPTPTGTTVTGCGDYCSEIPTEITSATPTFSAQSGGSAGTVTLDFELWNANDSGVATTRRSTGSATVSTGQVGSWTLASALPEGSYTMRVRQLTNGIASAWAPWHGVDYAAEVLDGAVADDSAVAPANNRFSGTIVDVSGQPAANKTVSLFVEPNPDSVSQLQPGEESDGNELLQTTTTDAQGNYSFDEPSAAQTESETSEAAVTSFSVMAEAAAQAPSVEFDQRAVVASDGSVDFQEPSAENEPEDRAIPVSLPVYTGEPGQDQSVSSPSTMNTAADDDPQQYGPDSLSTSAGSSRQARAASAQRDVIAPICTTRAYDPLIAAKVRVGQYYSKTKYASGQFVYGSGWTSTLGTAEKVNGVWRAGKETTFTKTSAITFPRRSGRRAYWWSTYINYQKYKRVCTQPGKPNRTVRVWANPVSVSGGTYENDPKAFPTVRRCRDQLKGSQFDTSSAKAARWSAGVELPVLSVMAQTGYDRSTNLNISYSRDRSLCGTSAAGPASSSQLVAR